MVTSLTAWARRFGQSQIRDEKMLKVALLVYIFAGTTLAGSFMVAALAAGYDTLNPILISVAIGAVVAIPVSWGVARAIMSDR